jgi:gamma-glutamyl:cysteine ligase YbdK (ATP-grasp superfamily)
MLHEFIRSHHDEILSRTRLRVAARTAPHATNAELESGIPLFVDELVEMLRPHAEALDCVAEIEHARVMARRGTSADHQLRVYNAALEGGASDPEAQAAVVDWLIEQSVIPDGPAPGAQP